MHYRFASTFNNFFKALIKYINMQQDWPLRSLIIYRNLGQIMCTAVVLSCFFVYSFVYLFIYYSLNIFSLCVFVSICLFITTLISSYFPAWPSHSARLAFAISEWLCSLSFTIIYFLWLYTYVLLCCCMLQECAEYP